MTFKQAYFRGLSLGLLTSALLIFATASESAHAGQAEVHMKRYNNNGTMTKVATYRGRHGNTMQRCQIAASKKRKLHICQKVK